MAEEPPLLSILISRIDLLGFSVVRAEKKNETEKILNYDIVLEINLKTYHSHR